MLDLSRGKMIGQPEVVEGFFVVTVKCSCSWPTNLIGGVGTMRQCNNPECDWVFALTGSPIDTPQGPSWKIGFRRMPKQEPPK